MMEANTCYVLTYDVHSLAYYTHFFPIAAALLLSLFLLARTKFSPLSRTFAYFVLAFVFWLVCDIVTWTTKDYYLVPFFWSLFDYSNILFFLFGFQFLLLVILGKDLKPQWKWLGLIVTLPALYIVATGNSVHAFDQATCGNDLGDAFLNNYENYVELAVMAGIFVAIALTWFKKKLAPARLQATIVGGALLLFFLTFTVTDYLSVATNVYQIGLYGLMVTPIFLGLIVYAVITFETFNANIFGAQILVFSLMILIASEFLFVTTLVNRSLVAISLLLSGFFGLVLIRSVKREVKQRERIERLAKDLEAANEQQVVLIHFITHQIKGFVTKSRNIFSMALEGDFGPVSDQLKPMLQEGLNSDTKGVATIQEILNASNIKSGKVEYVMAPFDLKALLEELVRDLKPAADKKGVELITELGSGEVSVTGDRAQLTNAFKNLIDNSIKYTPKGEVRLRLTKEAGKVLVTIKDTGVGITAEDMKNLFTEGGHGKDSTKVNVESTGFGLYIVKNIIDAHKGRVWAESEGAGAGSRFIVSLPL